MAPMKKRALFCVVLTLTIMYHGIFVSTGSILALRQTSIESSRNPTILFRQFSAEFLKLVPECKVCSSDYFLYFEIILSLFPYYPGKLRVKIPEYYLKIRPSMTFGHLQDLPGAPPILRLVPWNVRHY